MTHSQAAIIALMNLYLVPGFDYPISLLEIQKLVYFLKERVRICPVSIS